MPESLTPRSAVRNMAPYSPPTGSREGKLRLDFNENTVGCSPKVIAFLQEKLNAGALTIYPEYVEATRELAEYFDVTPAELMLTNGTDEAIQVLVNTFVDDADEVVILQPSYAMYRFYSELAGASVCEVDYHPQDLTFPLQELIAAITPRTRAVFVANPNNPTGTGIDLRGVMMILEAAPHAAVLIDEAYFEFCGITALPLLRQFPNLFISRTFSKVFGMAAMRCGVMLSQAGNIRWMHKAQSPYSVNMLAALAARAAIQDREYVTNYVNEVLRARELVYQGLSRLGIPFYPSQANFVLFRAGSRSIAIRDTLRERGVLVRDRSYEIPGCVRVTIGNGEQVNRFLTELEDVWTK